MSEIFQRTELLIGSAKLERLRQSRVAVIGLGAVGSYAVEALARAGVGNLLLIDHDVIEQSNINRQLYALHSTLGMPKADLAADRVKDINPQCCVTAEKMFVDADSLELIFSFQPDVVVDAVDSLNAKVNILAGIYRQRIPVISSMGAALRTDPLLVRYGDISETRGCPLARLVRQRLKRMGINKGIGCVYSTENVALHAADQNLCDETVPVSQGRPRRPLGSLPTLTGIFGLTVAHYTIQRIIMD